MNEAGELSQEDVQRLTTLVEEAERELALGVQDVSNRAFNLGCALWFIPGAIVVVAAFLLSRGNWVIAFLLAVLVSLLAVGFALVSAYNTKNKAIVRLYREITLPQLVKDLAENHLGQPAFWDTARQILPSNALLRRMLDETQARGESDPEKDDRSKDEPK